MPVLSTSSSKHRTQGIKEIKVSTRGEILIGGGSKKFPLGGVIT